MDTAIGSIIERYIVEPIRFQRSARWNAAVIRNSDNRARFLPKAWKRHEYPHAISRLESRHVLRFLSHELASMWPKGRAKQKSSQAGKIRKPIDQWLKFEIRQLGSTSVLS
jgi:hypothetical protein